MKNFFKRLITAPLYFIAAIIVLLEDWLWDDLQRLAQWLGHLPVFHQFEALVVRLPPTGALAFFLVPTLLLFPVKLAALWFISGGHAVMGIATMVAAKIAGTALVARIFKLTKPKLLTFRWFAWLYRHLTEFKRRIYELIRASSVYRSVHAFGARVKRFWQQFRQRRRSWFRRRFRALRTYWRRRRGM